MKNVLNPHKPRCSRTWQAAENNGGWGSKKAQKGQREESQEKEGRIDQLSFLPFPGYPRDWKRGFAHVRYGRSKAAMVGTFRRWGKRNEEKRWNYTGGFLSITWLFGCDICLFAVIYINPAWTRRDRGWWSRKRRGRQRRKDERILKLWVGMEISLGEKKNKNKKKPRWKADGISRWHDSIQPRERRSTACAITRHVFASIWSLKTLSCAGIWASVCVWVCEHVWAYTEH